MNALASPSASIKVMFASMWRNRVLVMQMARREIVGRYKGSIIGLGWSFINPLFLLAVYTFMFTTAFKPHWGSDEVNDKGVIALMIFAGMTVHGFLSEVLGRTPNVIVGNANFVRKIVFPLEILPVIALVTALFHYLVSLMVLLLAVLLINGYLYWTAIFLPFILVPMVLLMLGLGWFMSSMGVYFRDVGQTMGLISMALLFLSPVFYPIDALPLEYRAWLMWNPLTFTIEQVRDVLLEGELPDFFGVVVRTFYFFVVAWLGFAWFQKTRRGFPDVL